jgi:hypothetical protein
VFCAVRLLIIWCRSTLLVCIAKDELGPVTAI